MAVKEYFRNIGMYEANSMNSFMKRAKIGNTKSIDVVIEYLYLQDPVKKPNMPDTITQKETDKLQQTQKEPTEKKHRKSPFSDVGTRIVYEAVFRGYTTLKTRFVKTYEGQYDALICTEKKIDWLKKKLPNINITIKNSNRQDIEPIYKQLLKVAHKQS
jgi:hypothetical protein